MKEQHERRKREEIMDKYEAAALVIQNNIRRFLAQKQRAILLLELEKRKLDKKLNYMKNAVSDYKSNLNNRSLRAAIYIQSYWRCHISGECHKYDDADAAFQHEISIHTT